jgi:hypothetical protein
VRHSSPWLAAAASIHLFACYAELPGSASPDNPYAGLDAGAAGGTEGGSPLGGTFTGGGTTGGTPGGSLDGSMPLDAGPGSDAAPDAPVSCEGVAVGQSQTRTRYAELQVVPPATCKSETQTRTCRAGGLSDWTGTYQAEACTSAMVSSCGSTPHAGTQSRQRYAQAKVSDFNLCTPETQTSTCNDGTFSAWSGSAQYESCQVSFLGKCGLFSSVACEANTECQLKAFMIRCLGLGMHACQSNGDCVNTCVGGSCTASSVQRGGACDDVTDCSSATCTTSGGVQSTAGCVANLCACNAGNTCTANAQCVGTCVNSLCVAANTSCDKDDDCRGENKCIKAGSAATGTCLLPDGKACSLNSQCEHVCRSLVCDKRGTTGDSCDSSGENADCAEGLVCRSAGLVNQCQAPADVGGTCDETADCGPAMTCYTGGTSKTCVSSVAGATGAYCVLSVAAALQCASEVCLTCTGTPQCATVGTCQ